MEDVGQNQVSQYKTILENFNKYFTFYRELQHSDTNTRIFHATSQYLSFCQRAIALFHERTQFSNSSSRIWEQLEKLLDNIRQLEDLKITFGHDHIVDLSLFHSLKHLQIAGPCATTLKGLRALSSRLDSLIIQKSDTSLHTLLSKCCVDESGPMSWPCLYALHVTHSSLATLDSCLKLVPCLQQLDVSFNKLTIFDDKQLFLEQLTHLNLSFNMLTEVKVCGAARWRLQILLLAYNEMSSLAGLESLENLLVLDLSYNLLTSHDTLQPLRHLHNLEELNLSGNPLCFHKQHRFLSIRHISPSAIKPEFLLDGKTLTKKELKDVMYTPVAVSLPPTVVGNTNFSINASGDHRYDVSMSSPMENARRRNDVVSRSFPFKSRKKPRPVLETASSQQPAIISREEINDDMDKVHQDVEEDKLSLTTLEALNKQKDNVCGSYHSLSSADSPLGFEDDSDSRSIVSAISQDSDGSSEGSKSAGSASALSCRDEESRRTTVTSDEYFSTIDDYNVYDKPSEARHSSENVGSASSDKTERKGSTTDSRTSETDTLIGNEDDLEKEEEVTPPLHVKRKLMNIGQETTQAGREPIRATDVLLLGPEEVYLAATHNHLIERDIETGKVWEQLELTTITDVSLRFVNQTPELEVKFTYLRKDRRSRHYVVCDIGANEAVNLLFRELESISIRNRCVRSRNYVCLKCSRNFVTDPNAGQNSALDSYALQSDSVSPGATFGLGQSTSVNKQKTSGVVCSCGSEMVVETEGRCPKISLYTVGEDECAEATENNVSMARQRSLSFEGRRSASVDVSGGGRHPAQLRRVATVDATLSWMNSLQSVQNMSNSFSTNQHAGTSDMESHLSGSLPADISSVMMRPGNSVTGGLETAVSVHAVDRLHQQATPFKTFSHLLTTHDLYKLVDVTSSVLVAGKGTSVQATTEDSGVFTPNQPEMSLNSPALTKDVQLTGHRQVLHDGKKMVVTSTPRRRPAAFPAPNPVFSADSRHVVAQLNTDVGRGPKRRRALDFEGESLFQRSGDVAAVPVEYYEWDEPEISMAGENCCFDIDPKLKRFIEDELLEAEEELCAVVQTRLGHRSGKELGEMTPKGKGRKKKSNWATPKSLQIESSEEEDKEEDVLLLLTTENVQILRIEKKKKISSLGPDTLDCFASHHLTDIMGVEFGMSHTMLFFAVSTGLDSSEFTTDGLSSSPSMNKSLSARKKKKITLDQIDVIYTVFLRDQVKCERFYRRWMDLYKMRRESSSRAASTVSSNNSTPRSDRKAVRSTERGSGNALLVQRDDDRCVSALSDGLEKNFSEHVLMNLDLNLPEAEIGEDDAADDKKGHLLTESLFVYIPCWILDEESGKDRAVSIVVSCGGSLALVVEESTTVMKEFASALVRVYNTKQAKGKVNSPSLLQSSFSSSSSFSQSSTTSFPINLPQLALPSLAKALYTMEDLAKCGDLRNVVRFREQPSTLELSFRPSESKKQARTWHLSFAWPFTVANLLDLVSANWRVAQGKDLEVLWK